MKITPRLLKFGLNIYGPYLGAGVRVRSIAKDFRQIRVAMKLSWFNRNIMGVHFGGSLYSMVDPHLMLMLMQVLGKGYHVWDQSAQIDFVKPGRGKVHSILTITDDDLVQIKAQTRDGNKYLHHFKVTVRDEKDEIVARANKVVYVRKKSPKQRPDSGC